MSVLMRCLFATIALTAAGFAVAAFCIKPEEADWLGWMACAGVAGLAFMVETMFAVKRARFEAMAQAMMRLHNAARGARDDLLAANEAVACALRAVSEITEALGQNEA